MNSRGLTGPILTSALSLPSVARHKPSSVAATLVSQTPGSVGANFSVRVVPDGSPVANYAFDVTPARLVTGLITERGVVAPERAALARAFTERATAAK